MKIDTLIKRLQSERLRHGNIEVVLDGEYIKDIAVFNTIPEGGLPSDAKRAVWLSIHEAE